MNADPTFAQDDRRPSPTRTRRSIATSSRSQAHEDAAAHIDKNERHVIYAYAAMWIVAALFVIFLWLRQQKLNAEIIQLRADLDAAIKQPATTVEPVPSK